MKILEVNHLYKSFKKLKAVNDLSFGLEEGKIYGFIGPNGAGKSTTINLIAGLLKMDKGDIRISGHSAGSKKANALLGFANEFPSFYHDLDLQEFLSYSAALNNMDPRASKSEITKMITAFELNDFRYKKVTKFSTGMKKKVGLIAACLHKPKLLLLDEPTANLDPLSRKEIIDTLENLAKESLMTIFISSHVLSELDTFIDHIIAIDKGKLMLDMPLSEARHSLTRKKVFLKTALNRSLEDYFKKLSVSFSYEGDKYQLSLPKDSLKEMILGFCLDHKIIVYEMYDEKESLESFYDKIMKKEVQQ